MRSVLAGHYDNMRRKTDASDAGWIADLLAHGLLKPSFAPPVAVQDLRDWNALRVKPLEERTRIEKVLGNPNLKLSTVVGRDGTADSPGLRIRVGRPPTLMASCGAR